MNPTLHSFAYSLDYLREQVADVSSADMSAQPRGVLNHPAWVIGHLTHTCEMLGGAIGLPPWLPADWAKRFGTGSAPVADASAYDTKDALLARLADAQSRLSRAVERLTDAQLDEPFPDPSYLDVFPTIRHALTQVLVGHASFHVGQVSVWRRAMSLPPMRRGFE
jgi:hypothetical protein